MLVQPGKLFPASVLWPDTSYPQSPLLLECAGPVTSHRGHRRNEWLWILWRFDVDLWEWVDVGRALAVDASWAHALRPIAVRELRGAVPAATDPVALALVADRLAQVIDSVLDDLPRTDRPAILARLESTVAARLLAAAA